MTVQDIRARVAEIEALKYDDEAAHGRQDDLYHAVLTHLAEQGHPLAAEAIKAADIEFSRWCA